jgi:eukaryotic-like serine/threonine-protein kinase
MSFAKQDLPDSRAQAPAETGGELVEVGADRFEIRQKLGEGTFGVVYEVLDRHRGEVVALKTLRTQEPEGIYWLKREFRALADLVHPNLVSLHELLWSGGRLCFTMELLHGHHFLDYARPASGSRPIDAERIRRALVQLADGLTTLHRAQKLHRDIKPANVFVTERGRVVLLDFGLVFNLPKDGPNEALEFAGTPAYMSPEQATGMRLSPASDWYSVGVMLYEALTGNLPPRRYASVDLAAVEAQAGLPRDLLELSAELLQLKPQQRADGPRILRRLMPALLGEEPSAEAGSELVGYPFVGRERELETLRESFGRALEGTPQTVFVAGSSGVGKSAVIARFIEELVAERPDAVVLSGRCYERETVPYKGFDALVDATTRLLVSLPSAEMGMLLPPEIGSLARLFPVLETVGTFEVDRFADAEETRRRGFAALRALFGNLARRHPLVLFVDDLQWGDVDSAGLLANVIRPPDAPPLLFIGAYRVEHLDTSPFLCALRTFRDFTEPSDHTCLLAVDPLPAAEAELLAGALLGDPHAHTGPKAAEIAREAHGNPFFIGALVELANTRSALTQELQRSEGARTEPFSLDAVVQLRAALLPREARKLLEVVAVAGQPIRRSLARLGAGLDEGYQAAVALLQASHLVRTRVAEPEELIEPFHDRIRETVVVHLSPDTRRSHHAALADAWERIPDAEAETLAVHFMGAGVTDKALQYARLAADRAFDALAFDRASRLYRLALELDPVLGERRRALQIRLGDALAGAGRGAESADSYLAAAEKAPDPEALECHRRAAQQLLGSGRIERGLPVLETVLAAAHMRLTPTRGRALLSLIRRRLQVRLRGLDYVPRRLADIPTSELARVDACWTVAGMLSWVDTVRVADFQALHLLLALRCGDPYRVARALALEAGYASTAGERSMSRTLRVLAACRHATEQGERNPGAYVGALGGVAYSTGHWRESIERCLEATEIYRAHHHEGFVWVRNTFEFYILSSLLYLGEWKALAARLSAVMHDALMRGDLLLDTYASIRFASPERLLLGDNPVEAAALLKRALAQWPQRGLSVQHFYGLHQGTQIRLYTGDPLAAWEHLERGWSSFRRSGLLRVQNIRIEAWLLRGRVAVALASGSGARPAERSTFLRRAEGAARRLDRERGVHAVPTAALFRAGLASARGETERALEHLEAAEAGFEHAQMAAHSAVARLRRGALLGERVGSGLVESGNAWLLGQGVRSPERVANLIAPGYWRT